MTRGPQLRIGFKGMSLKAGLTSRRLAVALMSAAVFGALAPGRLAAQNTEPTAAEAARSEAIKRREQELEAARSEQRSAAEREKQLRADIAALGQDRTKLNKQLIDTAANVHAIEGKIGDAEKRLASLDGREETIRKSLDERRDEIAEVLAALQRAGRRPPPALLVRPEDALQSLRTAMLLGAVVPDMRARAERIAADLGELLKLRTDIATERTRLGTDRDRLAADQQQLSLLVEERQKKQSDTEKELEAERQRATTIAKQVDSLQELIAKMEQDLKSAAKAAAAASLQGTPATVNGRPNLGALKDAGRLSPAVAFASAKGILPMPVSGVRLRNFGASDGGGGQERGLSVATRAGAQVTTPCDGWVVYAGPFRSYGQLLILNAGGGYHVLLAGMERISVNIGQFVLTGEPVATMGTASRVAAILATAPSQPVLYIEFRKDGTPIDPGPWWATGEGEKVRG